MARPKDPAAEPPADPVEAPVAEAAEAPIVVEEAAPKPAAARGPGLLGPLLGGALAAIAGFGLSHFNLLGLQAPDSSEALAALEGRLTENLNQGLAEAADSAALAALEGQVAALSDRLAELEALPPIEPPDLSALAGLEERLAAIEAVPAGGDASTAALAAKLAELERRLAAQPEGADPAEMEAALARLDAAEAEAAARTEEAAAATAAAARAMALDRLREAVAAGAPFEAELAAVGDPALTEALSPHAAGLATLATLQADFPEAARAALVLARDAQADEGWGARLLDFLADQTGARPLTPRDGDTPDAILSRADFALAEGRLAAALDELGALDPALQVPLTDWIARATARQAVDAALEVQ